LDFPEEDADILRLGTFGRQGEDYLQLPAKMCAPRCFPEWPDLGFLEFALVCRQSVALKTIILLRQFHPEYCSIAWFANICASRSLRDFAAGTPLPRHLFAPFTP
jgi:hypothetical protein